MRSLRLAVWVAVAVGATTAPVLAQNTSSSGTSVTGGTTTGTAAAGNTSGGSSGSSSSGSNASATTGQTNLATTTLATTSLPTISAPASIQNSSSNQAISTSNVFQQTFGNPYYPGRPSATNANPGGLGTPLYTSSGGTGRASGTAIKDTGGQIVSLPRNISFAAEIKFTAPAMAPGRLQTDLQGTIARTPTFLLSNPAAVQVQVDGNTVILRGAVTNEDESRMVEGIVRLTPGVGQITNQLAFPKP